VTAGTGPPALAADYDALRHGLGAHRLGRDVLAVAGPDAVAYLQGQCSQDVAALGVGGSAEALLLEPDGKLCALIRVVREADDAFVIDTDAGFGPAVAARLARFRLRTKVEVAERDWPCVALRGPAAAALAAPAGVRALPVGFGGVVGVDLLGPGAESAVPDAARWCGDEAFEALRIEAGIPVMGKELDGRTIAAEAGLLDRTVSFTKGCYTGQELVARLDARGNRVARRLCGLVVEGTAEAVDPGRLLGAAVTSPEGREVGRVTSAAWCPGLGRPAALAYLHRSLAVPGPVTVAVADGPDGSFPAEARTLPLVV
jgi:folate-binding protein YgfZ